MSSQELSTLEFIYVLPILGTLLVSIEFLKVLCGMSRNSNLVSSEDFHVLLSGMGDR